MERSDELRQVLQEFYDALGSGNLEWIDRHFSHDAETRGIGTDPQEFWAGARVAEVFKEQIEATGGMPVKGGDPEAYVEGSVGWVADRAKVGTPDGGELELRFTGVLRRVDGEWKFVQTHGSIGVANEESFGELPT